MKILQFLASKKYVGAERSFVELCNELGKQDEVVALVVKGCEFKDRFSPQVRVIELRSNPSRYNPWLYLEIASIIQKVHPDVVHAHAAKATQILYRVWKWMKFPFVATKRNSRKNAIFDKVPHLVAVSKMATERPDATIIYNAITPKELPPVPKEERFTIIAIGALRKVKGFDRLIESVKALPFNFQLWIVGEGEEREALEALVARYNLEDRVKFLGWREDTHILQARSHLQVIASHREGFSRVLIEGLFYSDVVISTKVGGSVEILEDRFLMEDMRQKIVDVYQNYEAYKEAFAQLKKRLQPEFLLSKNVERYRKLYKEVSR